jgi:hypothetical protein
MFQTERDLPSAQFLTQIWPEFCLMRQRIATSRFGAASSTVQPADLTKSRPFRSPCEGF